MESSQQKKKNNDRFQQQDSLNITEVLNLGGDESDVELLQGIDDNDDDDEIELEADDSEGEQLDQLEMEALVGKLGFERILNSANHSNGHEQTAVRPDAKLNGSEEADVDEQQVKIVTPIGGKSKKKLSGNACESDLQKSDLMQRYHSSGPSNSALIARFQSYCTRNHLLLKPGDKWFTYRYSDPVPSTQPAEEIVQMLEDYGSRLLKDEAALYRRQQESSKKSSIMWLKTVLTSGTQADKVAALVLQVQEAPIHNFSCLDSLILMAKKKSRRESLQLVDTLKELFVSDLLMEDCKLKTIDQHPLCDLDQLSSGNRDTFDRRVLIWYFESQLKKKYAEFVAVLEQLCHDKVVAVRKKAMNAVLILLCERPEQEKKLLSMLVNKLGDPDYKIAANTSYLLSKLVARHPVMKAVVISELERLLYRANVSVKAQYYGVCFLNQLILNAEEQLLASRLLAIYFTFFKMFVKKGEVESKILSALLTGVNRAYPYAKPEKQSILAQVDTLYKIVHVSKFNTSVQALMLIYQVIDITDCTSDRYFVALYRKLQDPSLQSSTKLGLFLNLVFKSLKCDVVEKRVQAFVKRLLQVSLTLSPPVICASLYLLSELLKTHPQLLLLNRVQNKFDVDNDGDDDDDEHFSDALDEDQPASSDNVTFSNPQTVSSWVHRKHMSHTTGVYDPYHRNPLYCHADCDCTWELLNLVNHYHPSVSLFARMLLCGQPITYNGDPLEDFTLIRFVDRFVYRNPKKVKEQLPSLPSAGLHQPSKMPLRDVRIIPVNSDAYLGKKIDQIPADELFFYKFFSRQALNKKQVDDVDSDAEDVSDNEFDEFLDRFEHGIADADFDIDFASEIGQSKSKDRTKQKQKSSLRRNSIGDSSGDDYDEVDEDLSDEEVEFDAEAFNMDFSLDSIGNGDDVFHEEEVTNGNDNDREFYKDVSEKQKKHELKRLKTKRQKASEKSLFAAADEFSHLIENDAEMGHMIGTQAVSRADRAGMKQIKWEMERERRMNDRRRMSRRKPHQKAKRHLKTMKSKIKTRE